MHKIFQVSAIALVASLTLAGCSAVSTESKEPWNPSKNPSHQNPQDEIDLAVIALNTMYYGLPSWVNVSDKVGAEEKLTSISKKIDKKAEKLGISVKTLEDMQNVSPDDAAKLVAAVQSSDNGEHTKFIHYDGNFLNYLATVGFVVKNVQYLDENYAVEFKRDAITEADNGELTVDLSKATILLDGRKTNGQLYTGETSKLALRKAGEPGKEYWGIVPEPYDNLVNKTNTSKYKEDQKKKEQAKD